MKIIVVFVNTYKSVRSSPNYRTLGICSCIFDYASRNNRANYASGKGGSKFSQLARIEKKGRGMKKGEEVCCVFEAGREVHDYN